MPAPTVYSWRSSNPSVADLLPIVGQTTSESNLVYLVGSTAGEVIVDVRMTFAQGTGMAPYTANLAYCPPGDVNNCVPKRIAPVEIVP